MDVTARLIGLSPAAKKANKPVILEEFGVFGLGTYRTPSMLAPSLYSFPFLRSENKTNIYPVWVKTALDTDHA